MMLFEYRQESSLQVHKIANAVATMFYPFEDEKLHDSVRKDIIFTLKQYSNEYNEITEASFVSAMVS